MEIESVKVIKVKKEYINSMEGQNKLINIINGNISCEELIEYQISDYAISEIFREDYYIKNYQDDKEYKKERAVHALLFGVSEFFKEAIKDSSGIVYALSDSCDFCEED
ncbi:hypothetical protein [Clostridium scatologenes]|uniref:Uncharacterized protein n=1 Tax=Clostridium scatologenes TaxID=1548 RepID=A0A0E3M560_CLOSL|nr:hypothetical protein [Clostridium scatologenes]AKA68097.1 hypothetical protein CSCA_0972 [Clostridium scatologenes]